MYKDLITRFCKELGPSFYNGFLYQIVHGK